MRANIVNEVKVQLNKEVNTSNECGKLWSVFLNRTYTLYLTSGQFITKQIHIDESTDHNAPGIIVDN